MVVVVLEMNANRPLRIVPLADAYFECPGLLLPLLKFMCNMLDEDWWHIGRIDADVTLLVIHGAEKFELQIFVSFSQVVGGERDQYLIR